jgi:hypothetical protein
MIYKVENPLPQWHKQMETHFLNKYLIYLLLLLSQTDPYSDTLPKQISDLPVTTTVTNRSL